MVTGSEIILRVAAKALLLPANSANHHGNLCWGACFVTLATQCFVIAEKLNQAHPVRKVLAVALL